MKLTVILLFTALLVEISYAEVKRYFLLCNTIFYNIDHHFNPWYFKIKLGSIKVPISNCPDDIVEAATEQLNHLRAEQELAPLKYSQEMATSASNWVTYLATTGEEDFSLFEPDYALASQYLVGKSAIEKENDDDQDPDQDPDKSTLNLSDMNLLGGWAGKELRDRKPTFTGENESRPLYDDEWSRTEEFGVGCAAWQINVFEGDKAIKRNIFRLGAHFKLDSPDVS